MVRGQPRAMFILVHMARLDQSARAPHNLPFLALARRTLDGRQHLGLAGR